MLRSATTLIPESPALRCLLLALLALHVALGAAMGLSVDEAHYALYAAHPALSYFDHPPMVGWVQIPLVALGAPDAVLRLVPGILWLLTVVGVYHLARRLQADRSNHSAGVWAVLVLALAPLLHILGIGLLPDTLLMALSVALMHQTLTLMQPQAATQRIQWPRQGSGQWMVLGLLLGLAGLSKYTAVFAAAAVAVCLLAAHGGRLLLRPGVWLAALLALLLISPVVVWNAQNQWISFAYQIQHGAGGSWQAMHLARFLVVQLLVYGPLLLWGLWGVRRVADARHRWLVLFFVIPFAVLAYLSGGGSSLPHWTAPAWVALAPFAGLALAGAARSWARRWVLLLAVVQGGLCIALPALMVTGGAPFFATSADHRSDAPNPFADVHGWQQAGARANALAAQHRLTSVSVQNWTLASRLGWYARPLPVHVLEDRFDQFDIWAGDLQVGGNTLLVDWSQMAYTLPVGPHGFAACTLLESLPVQRLGQPVAQFWFYSCQGWSGSPQPQRQPQPQLQSDRVAPRP